MLSSSDSDSSNASYEADEMLVRQWPVEAPVKAPPAPEPQQGRGKPRQRELSRPPCCPPIDGSRLSSVRVIERGQAAPVPSDEEKTNYQVPDQPLISDDERTYDYLHKEFERYGFGSVAKHFAKDVLKYATNSFKITSPHFMRGEYQAFSGPIPQKYQQWMENDKKSIRHLVGTDFIYIREDVWYCSDHEDIVIIPVIAETRGSHIDISWCVLRADAASGGKYVYTIKGSSCAPNTQADQWAPTEWSYIKMFLAGPIKPITFG